MLSVAVNWLWVTFSCCLGFCLDSLLGLGSSHLFYVASDKSNSSLLSFSRKNHPVVLFFFFQYFEAEIPSFYLQPQLAFSMLSSYF